eukprot:CAMPEP_0194747190 /NCGR_PEP_ID=MMETSP0323_2-20130528/1256_1 /TAXON_ID=2866 ORGANISM="Crypthecodinium cohnii, Strain Seligo" /NCGR_SAMPLE_ID=MMETSP0323_2 /ASSEMBLY_ACC=CAM_ASM_000346 /LENGTH=146 /DNA_ID=CAMNT_0039660311 /DNA_START=76 /DNA_END=513 /DNA_ORIENTATION=-
MGMAVYLPDNKSGSNNSCQPRMQRMLAPSCSSFYGSASSRASGEGPRVRGVGVLPGSAETVDLLSLRVQVVRVGGGRSSQLPEEALHFGDNTLRDDGRGLVEVQPSDGPTMRNAHWHRVGTHGAEGLLGSLDLLKCAGREMDGLGP